MVFLRFMVVFLLSVCGHASSTGLTLELVHRDHLASPQLSRADRLSQMVRRDMQRWNNNIGRRRQTMKEDDTANTTISSGHNYGINEYIVKLHVGTPPQTVYMVPDMESILNMFKCRHNGTGFSTAPFFDADKSTSFEGILCQENLLCKNLTFMIGGDPKNPTCLGTSCGYSFYGYLSNFSTSGIFAHESFTFPQPKKAKAVVLKKMVIGCSNSGENLETINGTHGVLGLGISNLAFPAQASPMLGQKMFAMCLVDHLSHLSLSGIFVFGPVPKGVLPLTMNYTKLDTTSFKFGDLRLYGLNVKGVYVNGKRMNITSDVWNNTNPKGGTVVDTGTSVTYLNKQAYRIITHALNQAISRSMDSVVDTTGAFDYCYSTKKNKKYNESSVPKLEIEFDGRVRLQPARKSYFIDVSESMKCLGFKPSIFGYSTIGNILLQEHFLHFDVQNRKFGLGKTVCKGT